MFVMRLMHSRRDFAWLYARQDQTSFLVALPLRGVLLPAADRS
jgi:hypothetical protein